MSEKVHEIQAHHEEERGDAKYSADEIRVLEGLEAVRKRPGYQKQIPGLFAACILSLSERSGAGAPRLPKVR